MQDFRKATGKLYTFDQQLYSSCGFQPMIEVNPFIRFDLPNKNAPGEKS